jgi:chemotaxis protein methyltransferase CheR
VEEVELELLLEGVWRQWGLDFRHYQRGSALRRVMNAVHAEGVNNISALQERVLRDELAMSRLTKALSVSTTAMFRDPDFFLSFRQRVVPHLFTHPFVRIWHAGCSTGEEVYSLAIVLAEEGLYEKARIYATDLNAEALEKAQRGVYSLRLMQEYTHNHLLAGGKSPLSQWYTAQYDHALFKKALRKNVVFAQHNLTIDGSFNEFNVILCRNVLIYFDKELQGRAHRLFYESLRRFGVLALGKSESLQGSPHEPDYEPLVDLQPIYRRRA